MPKEFLDCIKKNGKVFTKKLKGDKYIKICKIGGKTYTSEVHSRKDSKGESNVAKARRTTAILNAGAYIETTVGGYFQVTIHQQMESSPTTSPTLWVELLFLISILETLT